MDKKTLIIHIPVIHKGYLDFLQKQKDRISRVFVFDNALLQNLGVTQDIASIDAETIKQLLSNMGFQHVSILSKDNIGEIGSQGLILIQDEISRKFCETHLKKQDVEWISVFLRWDKDSVASDDLSNLKGVPTTSGSLDMEMMGEAYKESEKSGDWWRQVGAVLVKDGNIVLRAYNQGMPSDHTPYQTGAIRDLFKAGEKPELANTIHAEQSIVAEAAREGIALEGTSLYVTHFPCPVCTKLIVHSGIASLYFKEGSAVFDGKIVLETGGVKLFIIPR